MVSYRQNLTLALGGLLILAELNVEQRFTKANSLTDFLSEVYSRG